MTRIYAIGDIHGQLAMLRAAHARIAADRAACGDTSALVIHLGDLVDRGPDSAGVIDFLLAGEASGAPWLTLQGNHDKMFRGYLDGSGYAETALRSGLSWLDERLGGAETLSSYGVNVSRWSRPSTLLAESRAAVPQSHRDFLARLPNFHATTDLIFVHAGIRPGVPISLQEEEDLIWIRAGFLDDDTDHGQIVVHGHTPVEAPRHFGNRIDLDTGAGYGHPLTAAVFEGPAAFVLTDQGRVPLLPD